MIVEQRNIEHTIDNLSLVCEQRTNKKLNYPEFQQIYSENLNFLKTVDFPETLRERILSLPEFPKPSILTSQLGGEYFVIFGTLTPFFAILIAALTAPLSIPLITWNIATRNRIKSDLKQCTRTLSSVQFLLERPNLKVDTGR